MRFRSSGSEIQCIFGSVIHGNALRIFFDFESTCDFRMLECFGRPEENIPRSFIFEPLRRLVRGLRDQGWISSFVAFLIGNIEAHLLEESGIHAGKSDQRPVGRASPATFPITTVLGGAGLVGLGTLRNRVGEGKTPSR